MMSSPQLQNNQPVDDNNEEEDKDDDDDNDDDGNDHEDLNFIRNNQPFKLMAEREGDRQRR